jgi:hypothetical protein
VTSILQSTETSTDLTADGGFQSLQSPDQLPVTSLQQSTETTTDLTAVGEVLKLAESRPAAGDEHFADYRNNY